MSLYHVSLSVNGEVVVKYRDCCFKMYLNRIFKYTYSEFLKGNARARWSDFVYINCGSLLDWIWDTQVIVKELVHLGTAEALMSRLHDLSEAVKYTKGKASFRRVGWKWEKRSFYSTIFENSKYFIYLGNIFFQ